MYFEKNYTLTNANYQHLCRKKDKKMIKTLLKETKQYKSDALKTPLYMLLEVAMEMIIPLLMAVIVDDGVNKGDMSVILKMGAVMLVMAGIGLFAGIRGGTVGARAATGLAKNLRLAMFKNIQTFSFKNIDKFSQASLITRLTTDVTNVQNAYQMALRLGTRAPASLIVAMILSYSIEPELANVYLVAVVILAIILTIGLFSVFKIFSVLFERYDKLNNSVQENITGMRVVKAYVREAYEKSKFAKASRNLAKQFIKGETIVAFTAPVMMLAIYGCILLISWFGANMIVVDELTTGELMSMLAYCMNILISLMMLSVVFLMISISTAASKRICEVLEEKPDIVNPDNPVGEVKDGSIDFNSVDFSYNEDGSGKVLDNVNLHIKSGEIIGIIGGTGSGKTTLVNLISRLYDVNKGEVLVGGENVKNYDLEVLRKEVSHVLQANVLFSGTIYENLRWGDIDASDEECKKACELSCASEFIERMPDGYNTRIEQGGTNVSGGQRQRLCIARALLRKPKILILDDSTSAVDTATDAKIRRAFREEIPNTTKLIIAQRVSSVQDADRIIVMDDGNIDGIGTHEELLASNEIYKDVYESQTGAGSGDFDEEEKDG